MKLNKSLVIGSLILILIIFITAFPSLFTDVNPYSVQTLKYSEAEEGSTKNVLRQAPFEPRKGAIMGTDEIGRDVFSFIIYGTRLTLKIAFWVTLIRFLVAIPIGMLAGFGNSISKTVIRQFNILFNGLPSLLFAVLVLNLNFFSNLDKKYSAIAFITVLTVVGWSKLGKTVEDLTKGILNKPFITSEYALGKTKFDVAVENVMPHLMPEIVVLLFMEMARALTMIIQLGIFSIFIGNLRLVLRTDWGNIIYRNISFEPEWASLLGSARRYLRSAPWMVVYPALAFFISVLGFNMFGEGLRIKLQDKNSMFIPKVRKILSTVFISDYRRLVFKSLFSKTNLLKKSVIIVVVMLILVIPSIVSKTSSQFTGEIQVFNSDNLPEKLLIGMPEIEAVANELSSNMEKLGLVPLYDDFKKYYDVDSMAVVRESVFKINGASFVQDLDYVIYSFGNYDIKDAPIVDTSLTSLYDLKDFSMFKDHVVLIDGQYYNEEAIAYFTEVFSKTGVRGVLIKGIDRLKASVGDIILDVPVLLLRGDYSFDSSDKVTINYNSENLKETGINVIGVLPGEDEKVGSECIILGLPLNYLSKDDGTDTYNYVLELIDKMVKRGSGRTIIFAFFDGNYLHGNHGLFDYTRKMVFQPLKTILYLDVMNIDYEDENKVLIDKEQAPSTRYFGISFLQVFTNERNQMDVEYMKIPTPVELIEYGDDPHLIMFHRKGVTTLVMDVRSEPDKFFEALLDTLIRNN